MPEAFCQDFPTFLAWLSTPDEFGKQMDGRFDMRVDVFLLCHDQMFLSQVESCVL